MTDRLLSARQRPLAVVAAALCAGLLAVCVPIRAQPSYRILVTNDDGIEATALEELVLALSDMADVIVAAPAEDRSYYGLAKTIPSGMLRIKEVKMKGAVAAFAIEGTAVDAVNWAILTHGQELPFDAVIAGVNRGSTLGHEALSIGVVGAAIVAGTYGLPGIAVAQDRGAHVYDVAAGIVRQVLVKWVEEGLDDGVALSINVPAAATTRPRGVVAAPLGEPEYNTLGFKKVVNDDPRELWRVQFKKNRRPERGTDLDWYQRGEITITPLRMGATAADLLETLESWELEAKRGP